MSCGLAETTAGGLDAVVDWAFSHVAGTFSARMDQQSAAYQIGSLVADPAADAAVAGDAARVGEESIGVGEGALAHPTGAYNPSASGTGVGLGRLADRSINVFERGLNLVKGHLARFAELYGSIPYNDAMIGRLQNALDAGLSIEGAAASFYLHEASEASMTRVLEQAGSTFDAAYDVAHSAALAKYDVSPFSVYRPDVIHAFRADFSPAFRRFWGIG